MFPIRDDNPHFLTPYATYAIVAINVIAWLLLQGFGAEPALTSSVCNLGLIPLELWQTLPAGDAVRAAHEAVCAANGNPGWPALISHMFLHGSWMHIIGNMWFLWIFGNNVEDSMGHFRFVVFYLLCGLAAAGLQIFAQPSSDIPMVGASGAIGGVMGAYVVLYPRVHVHLFAYFTTFAVPAFFMLGYWLLVQVLGGVGSTGTGGGVAFWAHVGGFLAGAVLVFVFKDAELVRRHPHYGWRRRDAR